MSVSNNDPHNMIDMQRNSLGSGQALPFLLSKSVIGIAISLLFILTISGSSALLSPIIHPIGLVLGILIPAYFFLLFALIRRHSLFSNILFFLQKQLSKLQLQNRSSTNNSIQSTLKLSFQPDPQALQLLTKVIMHSAWLVIFAALATSFFFQFTLKQYQFNLYSTLFPEESGIYQQILQIINFLPNLIFGELTSSQLIINSLKGTTSTLENAIWARWILITLIIYGLLPRLLLVFISYRQYRHYQQRCLTPEKITSATVIDAAKIKPKSERPAKTISQGSGTMNIALDFSQPLSETITIINDRHAFTRLHHKIMNAPLAELTLYIDAALTPDRSLLRRLYTLLNLSVKSTIILVESDTHLRTEEWQQKILPNLLDQEQTIVQPYDNLKNN